MVGYVARRPRCGAPVRTGSREHPWAELEVVLVGCDSSRVLQLLPLLQGVWGGQLQKLFRVLQDI